MDAMHFIATARQQEMQAAAANERLAARLRRERTRWSFGPALARVAERARAAAPTTDPAPCPTC